VANPSSTLTRRRERTCDAILDATGQLIAEKGVDGFRMDVIPFIAKDTTFPPLPPSSARRGWAGGDMNRALGGELLAQNRDHLSTEHLQLLEDDAHPPEPVNVRLI